MSTDCNEDEFIGNVLCIGTTLHFVCKDSKFVGDVYCEDYTQGSRFTTCEDIVVTGNAVCMSRTGRLGSQSETCKGAIILGNCYGNSCANAKLVGGVILDTVAPTRAPTDNTAGPTPSPVSVAP